MHTYICDVSMYVGELEAALKCCNTCVGKLPIQVSEKVESVTMKEATPPPLPPKLDDSEEASLLPPKPKPRVGSLKQAPPRPPKAA